MAFFEENLVSYKIGRYRCRRQEYFQGLPSKRFRQSVQEVTAAVFEAACERVFGRTLALQTYTAYHSFFHQLSHPWPSLHPSLPLLLSLSSPLCFPLSFPSILPSCCFPPCTLLTFTPLSLFTSSSFYSPCPGLRSFRSVIWCVPVLCLLVGNQSFDTYRECHAPQIPGQKAPATRRARWAGRPE
jgi:hypothetical protein